MDLGEYAVSKLDDALDQLRYDERTGVNSKVGSICKAYVRLYNIINDIAEGADKRMQDILLSALEEVDK